MQQRPVHHVLRQSGSVQSSHADSEVTCNAASRSWWPAQALDSRGGCSPSAAGSQARGLLSNGHTNTFAPGISNAQDSEEVAEEVAELLGILALSPSNGRTSGASNNVSSVVRLIERANTETAENTQLSPMLSVLQGVPASQQSSVQPAQDHVISYSGLVPASSVHVPEANIGSVISSCGVPVAHTDTSEAGQGSQPGLELVPASAASVASASMPLHHSRVGGVQSLSESVGLNMAQHSLVFRPHPAWASQANCILYLAVFLTQESREVLLSMVPPKHPCIHADHMTLAYKPSIFQLLEYPLGAEVELRILGSAVDSRAHAVIADPPSWLPPTTSVSTHITISLAVGTRAVEAGHLIRDAMQRSAVDDPSNSLASGAGAFMPLEEALPLVGRIGVAVKPRSAVGDDAGDPVIISSIEELERSGYVTIGPENLQVFCQKHGAVLGKQALGGISSSRLSMVLESRSAPVSAAAPLEHASAVGAAANGQVSAADHLPPAPTGLVGTVGAARQHDSSVGPSLTQQSAARDQPRGLLSNKVGIDQVQLAREEADGRDSDSSSGSSSDVVQFLSMVHIGDYVAVRPFVSTASGDLVVRGFVTEYASDEPFQGNGVLVVLSDYTIGWVTAVLDAAAATPCISDKGASSRAATAQNCSTAEIEQPASVASTAVGADTVALSEWALSAHDAATTLVASQSPEAGHDVQLVHEFVALQQQFGEAHCNAILGSCGNDLQQAITALKGQTAAACAMANAIVDHPVTTIVAAGTPGAADTLSPDEDLAQQLALSLNLSADGALQLCRLAPHASAESVVSVLMRHGGDVQKAADALLSGGSLPAAGEVAAYGDGSSLDRTAYQALGDKDAGLVLDALKLCKMVPNMSQDTAELLLREHGGNLDQAVDAVCDMQASELKSRTAASVASVAPITYQSSLFQHLPQPQANVPYISSEEDQLAMLQAMGMLPEDKTSPRNKPWVAPGQLQFPPLPSPTRPPVPPPTRHPLQPPPPPLARQSPTPPVGRLTRSNSSTHSNQDGRALRGGVYAPLSQRNTKRFAGNPLAPGALSPQVDKQRAEGAREVEEQFKKTQKMLEQSKTYRMQAQILLKAGDNKGYQEKMKAYNDIERERKTLFAQVNVRGREFHNQGRLVEWPIDLHGQATGHAMCSFVNEFEPLLSIQRPGDVLVRVITGKGIHSSDNRPKIKLNILKYLEERSISVKKATNEPWKVDWEVDPQNEGCISILIPGTTSSSISRPAESD